MELANTIITLQPGMYILRHPKTGMPPISVGRAATNPAHNGRVEALYTPSTDGGVLRGGSDCILMQVLMAPADLLVTAYLEKAGAVVPTLKIDKVKLDDETPGSRVIEVPDKGITLFGHVELNGDMVAKPGETLGQPEGDLRLEGFQVLWPDKPEGVELQYSAQLEGGGPSPKVGTGTFCGTRNAARRVVGVTFELTGAKAADYRIQGEAQFSGGYKTPLQADMPVQGPSGMEHLTALRLAVVPVAGAQGSKKNPWTDSPRTRVLKGRGKK